MRTTILSTVVCALLLGACAATDNYTSRRKLPVIDYSAYKQPVTWMPGSGDDFTGDLPAPSVLEDKDNTAEITPTEDEDFTSEEIAASYGRYTDVTMVVATKRIKLGAAAASKDMAVFQQALDAAYKKALRTYRPSGFTYSISSVGAVNPLSDIEVSCILGEQAANEVGQTTCHLFFQTLVEQHQTLLQEAQENATL